MHACAHAHTEAHMYKHTQTPTHRSVSSLPPVILHPQQPVHFSARETEKNTPREFTEHACVSIELCEGKYFIAGDGSDTSRLCRELRALAHDQGK